MHEWNGRHFFALRLEHSCVRVTDQRDRTRNRVTKTIWVDRRRISKQQHEDPSLLDSVHEPR